MTEAASTQNDTPSFFPMERRREQNIDFMVWPSVVTGGLTEGHHH